MVQVFTDTISKQTLSRFCFDCNVSTFLSVSVLQKIIEIIPLKYSWKL